MNTAFFADKPTARKHEFKKFKPFKPFKTITGLFDDLNDWNDWNDLNGSYERSDITVDILSGYPILATYELTVCFGEASI